MQYVNLGETGLMVSEFGLGCGNFGGIGSSPEFFGQGESQSDAFAIMDTAHELGINFFDTADAYGGGRSEESIGKWLAAKGPAVRDQVLISSKVFNPVGPGPNDRGISRRHIMRQVEASLRRLGVEYLDMYLMHEPDPGTPIEETVRAMHDLVTSGKVRYIGASNMPAWLLMKALWTSDRLGLTRFSWVQNSYSLLDTTDDAEVLPACRDQRLGYTPFSPLAGGFLTGKYKLGDDYPSGSRMTLRPEPYVDWWNEKTFVRLDRFEQMAGDHGVSMAGLALAWLRNHPDVTAPIVGPRRPSHFEPVHEALELDLDGDSYEVLTKLFKGG
jgi:aryl-alcohol dehydrogenase-like predicted oxidoreductase